MLLGVAAGAGLAGLAACSITTPSMDAVRDMKLFDRRINETPRQKTVRECRQETERFRVECADCHTSKQEAEIAAPDRLLLTQKGRRAQVMRQSPNFGLYQQCSVCHQSKFALTGYAEKMFGPQGERHKELEQELNKPVK
jgi:mono/diheme cytochrome c family protein